MNGCPAETEAGRRAVPHRQGMTGGFFWGIAVCDGADYNTSKIAASGYFK